jgi:carboxyl-terminal processing protease
MASDDRWEKHANQLLSGTLTRYHYVNQTMDDNASKRIFTLILKQLDPNKHFFTATDVAEFTSYEYKIDNDIRNNTFHFYNLAVSRLNQQVEWCRSVYHTILDSPIDLNAPYRIELDPDKKTYTANNQDLAQRWLANLHYQVAQNYISLYQEAYPSRNAIVIEKDMEIAARKKTKKELDRRFKRLMNKTDMDYFTRYLNAISQSFGPHTSYLPPEEKKDFDINMSGQLEGIGAILREDDGYIKVVRIIPGSASWRQGKLSAEDIILSVIKNEGAEPVDMIETPVRDAVKLIRGPKGSTVTLTVKKPDGIIQTIPIKRDIVIIQSAYAKSGIFKVNNQRFGYINLPSFYRDFDNTQNRNAADDVKQALLSFNASGTQGMILDLRNNGGGSLKDAVDISGFFIPSGPVVQVANSYGRKESYNDTDVATIYTRPLIILTNTFSASASEIVSAALQDYGRAIVIGNAHTFGKGTVQKVVNLDNFLSRREQPMGFLKITIQEYFRITGKSTQFDGVVPDIIYPSRYDYLDVGEKELTFAFKGTTVPSVVFKPWPKHANYSHVIQKSYARLAQNRAARAITQYSEFMANERANSNQSVQISDLWKKMIIIKEKNDTLDALKVTPPLAHYTPLEPTPTPDDTDAIDAHNEWVKGFDSDMLLNEAFYVLSDIIDTKDTP